MTSSNQPEKPPHRKKDRSTLFISIIALVLLATGIALWYQISGREQLEVFESTPLATTADQEQTPTEQKTEQGEPPETLQQDSEKQKDASKANIVISVQKEPVIPPVISAEDVASGAPASKDSAPCLTTSENLNTFFLNLDKEEYIKEQNLGGSSQSYFISMANTLLDNPPVVARESDDLYTLLKNMAHFFRIIGKQNTVLIKSILDREREKIEDLAANLFFYINNPQCRNGRFPWNPNFEKVYEYAGFFINTMGGRSYLFRRDSRSRMLVNYYAIRFIDQANETGQNRYGIELAQSILLLIQDIEGTNQLIYRENYIDNLLDLQEKYQ